MTINQKTLLAGAAWAQTELPTLADRHALSSFSDQNANSYLAPHEDGYAVFHGGKPIAIADAGLANELRPDLRALAKSPKRRAVGGGEPLDPSSVFCHHKSCRSAANCGRGCHTCHRLLASSRTGTCF